MDVRPGVNVLGYNVYSSGLESCVDSVLDHIENGVGTKWMACLNPHSYVQACSDIEFSGALKSASWLIPDGAGVVLAARMIRRARIARLPGPDVFNAINQRAAQRGASIFLLGSTNETLARLMAALRRQFDGIEVVGCFSPPFADAFSVAECKDMAAHVNAAHPDILWVSMTAPKQEKWIAANHALVNVRFIGAVGAAFDFAAGTVQRSSSFMRQIGMEWLPRLVRQPRRLWRRTLVSAPLFLRDVLLECRKAHRS